MSPTLIAIKRKKRQEWGTYMTLTDALLIHRMFRIAQNASDLLWRDT